MTDDMEHQLYLECNFGISGDMAVAALLDLGANQESLERTLKSLSVKGFHTKISRVKKAGLDACDFAVILDSAHENHDHDMEFLHGAHDHEHAHEHTHEHSHTHEEHTHEHSHAHEEHTHEEHTHTHEGHSHEHSHAHEEHIHRGLAEIVAIIRAADMSERAKETAERIFQILGKAEAKAHGVSLEEVHFHEVGAVDSIVDIISFAVCLDSLKIDTVIIPMLYEGCGTIRCAHGILPVPVPAVSNIVADSGLKLHITETKGEFVTPTGAAIAAAIQTKNQLPEQFSIKRIGLGAGKRNYERPSLLRAMLIETEPELKTDYIYKLETNIDDCSPEVLGFVMEELQKEGARDVHYTPVFMKKNRPAYQLNVICKKEQVSKLEQIIFRHTTTIGIRKQQMERTILERESREIVTSLGTVQVKICRLLEERRCYPEYESVAALCREHGTSFWETYRMVERECNGDL